MYIGHGWVPPDVAVHTSIDAVPHPHRDRMLLVSAMRVVAT